MRIGLFTDTYIPDVNGVANSTEILRKELEAHGHDVYVVATRAGIGFSEWDDRHRVLRLAGVEVKKLYGYAVTTPLHLNAMHEIKKLDLDVIHTQTEFGVGIFGRICARQMGIPIVCTYHTTYEDYTHYINLINSKAVDDLAKKAVVKFSKLFGDTALEVIVPSKKTKELLEKYNVKTELHVVPTGLELRRFSPDLHDPQRTSQIRAAAGFSKDHRMIIFVGRIAEEKAIDRIIRGMALAHEQGCTSTLLIVGGGPDEEKLHKMVKDMDLTHIVSFAGKQPQTEVPDYYRAADAFISASTSETQGMTFAEAMASGLPLFARHDEVLDELLIPGKTGWYFENEQEFADCLKQFEQLDDQQLAEISRNCCEQVKPLSSEIFYERAMKVYEAAIELYSHMNIIEDIEVKDNFVQMYISSESGEETRILLLLDEYMNEGLRTGMRISNDQVEALKQKEKEARAYQKCIRKLAAHDRSKKELHDWLKKETDYSDELISHVISLLEERGLVNDEHYAEDKITSMKRTLHGEESIVRELREKGIPEDLVREKLAERHSDEAVNASEYAGKIKRTLSGESVSMLKRKLYTKMLQRGFRNDIIEDTIAGMDFSDEASDETENLRKCAIKAKKRYERKYSSSQLRNAVFRYCSTQGYRTEEIYAILDEMEWDDD